MFSLTATIEMIYVKIKANLVGYFHFPVEDLGKEIEHSELGASERSELIE